MSKVTGLQYCKIRDELIIEFLKTATPKERHQLISEWNWDAGGTDIFQWIAHDPNTDKATALMLYWKNNPWMIKKYASRDEIGEMFAYEFDIIEDIERLYLADFYQNHQFSFDPSSNAGEDGVDWTVKPHYIVAKREIPALMFEKLTGEDILCSEYFDEGIPPHIKDKMREFEIVG